MAHSTPSKEYVRLLETGPFPGRMDPFAEQPRYFQQLHAGMIGVLLGEIRRPLLEMGYIVGREASLQIAEKREPDVYVSQQAGQAKPAGTTWDYDRAAEAVQAEPGVVLTMEPPEVEAVQVRSRDTGQLVTVLEFISPRNKQGHDEMRDYRRRRDRLLAKNINLVEIDLTRSIKRLVDDRLVEQYAYHMAVFLPGRSPRFIGMEFEEPFKRLALPLREEVLPVDLQQVYEAAYREGGIPGLIWNENRYRPEDLPFPSLLSNEQRRATLEAVQNWLADLQRLSQPDQPSEQNRT